MRISDWSSDVCSSDLRRSRYRADIDHALRTAVSKPVAIEQRQCGAGPDAPQVEGRCPVDVDVLVLCALPRTDTGVLAADRKSTRLNSGHKCASRMPSSA